MSVYAIVPVKALRNSKRRLSAVLNPQERRLLAVAMLEDVLSALKASVVQETVIVSNDMAIRELADRYGAVYLEAVQSGLNSAIEEAADWCLRNGADSVLVLPADIPLVSSQDIDHIAELGADGLSVVLSPSHDGGTNAMFRNPPDSIQARFGSRSFAKHIKIARSKGVPVKFHCSLAVSMDIDSVQDLKNLFDIKNETKTVKVLKQIGLNFGNPDKATVETVKTSP